MGDSNPNWLREHMRDHIANYSTLDSAENILSFGHPPNPARNPGAAALDLVYQAAELIRDLDNSAAEIQARAETLAKQAIEKLKIADARVLSAESGRLAAEAKIKELMDRVEQEVNVRLQEVEKVMEQTASRMAAAEAQRSAAEQRARTGEMRANEAENALKRIEEAIRTRILEKRFRDSSRTAATAA
jgi:hypothetical protein